MGFIKKRYNLLFIFKFFPENTLKMIYLVQAKSVYTFRGHEN